MVKITLIPLATFVFFLLVGCGQGITSAHSNVSAPASASAGGGAQLINNISCTMTAGVPSYSNVQFLLTVTGLVDRIVLDGQVLPGTVDPITHTATLNYPISSPGAKTVEANLSNALGGWGKCSVQFTAPTLAEARAASLPTDNNNYQFHKELRLAETSGTTYRYLIAINKVNGTVYWNALSLNPKDRPGFVDAWAGWSQFAGLDAETDRAVKLAELSTNEGAYNMTVIQADNRAKTTIPIRCSSGVCSYER